MIKSNYSLTEIKNKIKGLQSQSVKVKLNLGRNKFVFFEGTLSGVYPALFTVIPFDKTFKGKTSYSYSDYKSGYSYTSDDNKNWVIGTVDGEESINLKDLIDKINNKHVIIEIIIVAIILFILF